MDSLQSYFNNKNFNLKSKINSALEYISEFSVPVLKNKSTWFVIVFGGSVGALYYNMKNKSRTQFIQLSKEKVQNYFEQSQQLSNDAVNLIIFKNLIEKELIKKNIDIAYLMLKIKSAEDKKPLTEQLKISIFTKLFTSLYSISLSLLLNRITVNLIGKYCYLDFIIYGRTTRIVDENSEKKFLSFGDYIYDVKFKSFVELIQSVLTDALSDWQIDKSSTYEGILRLLLNIRNRFEDKKVLLKMDNGQSILSYLVPGEKEKDIYDLRTKQLLDEVSNIFENEKFYDIFKVVVNESFLWFTQSLRKDFDALANKNNSSKIYPTSPMLFEMEIPFSPTIPNIALLPKINQHTNYLLNQDNGIIESIISSATISEKFNQFNFSILTNNINFNKLESI